MRAPILLCAAVFAMLLGPSYAQPGTHFPNPITGNAIIQNATTANTAAGNFSETNASAASVLAGESYISERLGTQYYAEHVSYVSGFYYSGTGLTYLYFSYSIIPSNVTGIVGVYGAGLPLARLTGITLTLNSSGDVTAYDGPHDPYSIRVSAPEAIAIAGLYGIINGTAAIAAAESPSEAGDPLYGYSLVWAVTGRSAIKNATNPYGNVYPGVYIDVVNGSVVGEYTYNPMIVAPQQGMSRATLGTFWLFPLNASAPASVTAASAQGNATQQGAVQFTQSEEFGIITAGAAGIIISAVAAVIAYRALSRRHK